MHRIYRKTAPVLVTLGLILGCWRGRVALFLPGEPEPIQTYDVRLEMLPPADRQALEEGMRICSAEELSRLLEDLLS